MYVTSGWTVWVENRVGDPFLLPLPHFILYPVSSGCFIKSNIQSIVSDTNYVCESVGLV